MSKELVVTTTAAGLALILLLPSTAQAYIGPGGVITAIGAALALLVAIAASIAGFLWYPLKRILAWIRTFRRDATTEIPASSDPSSR